MLATLVPKPFHQAGWVYEEKYDGYRILAYKEGSEVTLLSRNAKDRTQWFSSVARAVSALGPKTLLLDGEVVTFDRRGVSRFQLLQNREAEPEYAVFDCLYRDGRDLRRAPLTKRRRVLEQLHRKFQPLVRSKPPVADPPREKDVTYLAPRLVAQIAYEELTADQKLRQPVFLGLRDDKRPQDVTLPEAK